MIWAPTIREDGPFQSSCTMRFWDNLPPILQGFNNIWWVSSGFLASFRLLLFYELFNLSRTHDRLLGFSTEGWLFNFDAVEIFRRLRAKKKLKCDRKDETWNVWRHNRSSPEARGLMSASEGNLDERNLTHIVKLCGGLMTITIARCIYLLSSVWRVVKILLGLGRCTLCDHLAVSESNTTSVLIGVLPFFATPL